MSSIGSPKPKKKSKIDPFMALPDGSKSTYNTKNKNVAFMDKCTSQQTESFVHDYGWSILSLMGGVNYVIVKRSHAVSFKILLLLFIKICYVL